MSEQNLQQLEPSEDQLIAAAFKNIAARGSLTIFTELRDEAIGEANTFKKVAETYLATNEATDAERAEIMRLANICRNKVISLQTACDASFAFENITSSEGRRVN